MQHIIIMRWLWIQIEAIATFFIIFGAHINRYIDRNSGPFEGRAWIECPVRNANNPMPTWHGEAGTKLLSPHINTIYHYQSEWRSSCSLHGHLPPPPSPPIMLTIKPIKVIMFCAYNLIFVEHLSFRFPFLEPHQNIYQTNIGFQLS